MRKTYLHKLLVLSFCFGLGWGGFAFAQNPYSLLLESGTVNLPANYDQESQFRMVPYADLVDGRYYRYLQFNQIPTQQERETIEAMGIDLIEFIPNYTYSASIPQGFDMQRLGQYGLRSIFKPTAEHKYAKDMLEPQLPSHCMNAPGQADLILTYYPGTDKAAVEKALTAAGLEVLGEYPYSEMITDRKSVV